MHFSLSAFHEVHDPCYINLFESDIKQKNLPLLVCGTLLSTNYQRYLAIELLGNLTVQVDQASSHIS